MTVTKLQRFVEKYGPAAGPKLYHALQSRAAFIGANSRRRKAIADLTRSPVASKRPARVSEPGPTPLLLEPDRSDFAGIRDEPAAGPRN